MVAAPVKPARIPFPWRQLFPLGVLSLLLGLLALNIPFYAGSSLPLQTHWRLESGRLTLRWNASYHEGFFVDFNSEGLRWMPAWGPDSVTIPLWAFIVPAAVWTYRSFRRTPSAGNR